MVTDNKFFEVMEALKEIYEGGPASTMALKMYRAVIDRNFKSDEEFEAAAFRLMETRIYPSFPKPGEFTQILKPAKQDLDARVTLAQVELKQAIRKYGAYKSVAFEDYLIHAVVKFGAGSWVKLCKMDLEDLENFIKWDFPKLYKGYSDKKNIEVPLYLEGLEEFRNSQLGYNRTQIALIGDPGAVKRWQDRYVAKNKMAIDRNKLQALSYDPPKLETNITDKAAKEFFEKSKILTPEILEETKKDPVPNFRSIEEIKNSYKLNTGKTELTDSDLKLIERAAKNNGLTC